MILLIGFAVAVFVVPDPLTLPVIGAAVVLEVSETLFTLWLSRRGRPKVGVDTLVGADGRVELACHPTGRVRVRGESWSAVCPAGADAGDRVRVIDRNGLTLVVEPVADA